MPTWCNKVILLMYSQLDMFRVHTPIIRSIRSWVTAYGFLHRVFGLVVVLRAAAFARCGWCRATAPSTPRTRPTQRLSRSPPIQKLGKPYAAAQHLMLVMMGVCTRNMSSWEYINKITLLHQVDISNYFMRKMHGQTTLIFLLDRLTVESGADRLYGNSNEQLSTYSGKQPSKPRMSHRFSDTKLTFHLWCLIRLKPWPIWNSGMFCESM